MKCPKPKTNNGGSSKNTLLTEAPQCKKKTNELQKPRMLVHSFVCCALKRRVLDAVPAAERGRIFCEK